ncbi:MAG: hypothetical protein LBK25_06985 [Treponema sp.]|nr:hypothetical protein [Treponema sp.]
MSAIASEPPPRCVVSAAAQPNPRPSFFFALFSHASAVINDLAVVLSLLLVIILLILVIIFHLLVIV